MALPTLLDIAQSTGDDGIAGLIEEVIKMVPEIMMGAARTIKGIQFKTTVRTGLPKVSFRQANKGAVARKAKYDQRLFDCYIMDAPWLCDTMVADAHEDGAAAYIAAEGKGIVLADLILLGQQMYYGQPKAEGDTSIPFSDPLGFPGLLQMYDVANMTVDAAGTSNNTATSVWAVTWGDDGLQWLYGNGTNPLQLSDVTQVVLNDASGNPLTQYHQQLKAWIGLKLGSLKRVGCIKNLTDDAGKGLTDGRLRDLLQKFPVGYKPDQIFLTRRAMSQLIKSRTATTTTGQEVPKPKDFDGIPLIETDSIQDTEALR